MKSLSLPQKVSKNSKNKRFFKTILASLLLMFVCQSVHAQQSLSLADILIGLRSKKVTLEERNKLLTEAIKVRGVTFALTPEIEKELESTGATAELVEVVRQKAKLIAKPTPVSTPTPVATPPPVPEFVAYQKQADAHMVKGEYDMAIANYNKVIELNPKNSASYLSRGLSYFNKRSYDRAVSDYDKAIELAPGESIAYFNRAGTYERIGNITQAIADYQKTVDLDATNDVAKASLKRLQDEQAKAEQAKAEQARAEQLKLEQAKADANAKNTPQSKVQPKQSKSDEGSSNQTKDQAQMVSLGQISPGQAVKMVTPVYSPEARRLNLKGQVTIQISIDEEGNVISAKAVSGVGLLKIAAEDAALKSKFKPAVFNGAPAKATGYIVYNFK